MRSSILAITAAIALATTLTACARERGPAMEAPVAWAEAQAGRLVLIDIRRPEEWRQTGVAKGAREIDMTSQGGVQGFVERIASEVGGNRNAPIGLICRTGNRTTQVQRVLMEAGFTRVFNIDEGMIGSRAGPGWRARGLPIETCKTC